MRQQVRGSFDGAGHELREEGDEGEEGDDVACRGEFFAVDVDRVAQGLEGVERDADRQDDPQQEAVAVGDAEQLGERRHEEVVIFEDAEDCEVQQDVPHADGPAPSFPPPPPFPEAADKQSAGVAAQRREGDQQEKPPVPPSVEEVAGPYDEKVLRPQAAVEHKPVEQEDDREEQREFERIEKHGSKHDLRQIAGVGVWPPGRDVAQK